MTATRWAPPALPHGAAVRRITDHLRAHRGRAGLVLAAALAGGAIVAAGPLALRVGIDDGIRAGDRRVVVLAGVAYLVLLVVGGIIDGLRALVMAHVGQDFLHELRSDAMAGLLHLDLAEFESADRGDIQARLTSDVESLASASEDLLPHVVALAITIVGGLAAVLLLSPALAAITAAVVLPAAIAGRWLLRRSRVVYPELFKRNASVVGCLVELVEGAGTIAAHRAGDRRLGVLAERNRAVIEQSLTATAMRNWFYSTLLLLQATGTAAVVVAGALLVDRGSISVGSATAAVVALAGVFLPVSLLLGRLDDVLAARTALYRVAELAELHADADSGGAGLPHRGSLELVDVSYGYGDGPTVVDGVTFAAAPGMRVALVGVTGSGKSTIARLAVGLATPRTGRVTLGGVGLDGVDGDAVRASMLLIAQESFVLDATIADNARMSRATATAADVESAVDTLGLRQWIASLPSGIDTAVGPAGSRLSLGERQLVALLRAVVADPAVVVLDEATSVLDATTEAAVANALEVACEGRVAVIIAHRPETAARCDQILVVDDGRIVERGTHADLAASGGHYATLLARHLLDDTRMDG